jgi:hypothetical protein
MTHRWMIDDALHACDLPYTDRGKMEAFLESMDDCYPSIKLGYGDYYPSEILLRCKPYEFRLWYLEWLESQDGDSDAEDLENA